MCVCLYDEKCTVRNEYYATKREKIVNKTEKFSNKHQTHKKLEKIGCKLSDREKKPSEMNLFLSISVPTMERS